MTHNATVLRVYIVEDSAIILRLLTAAVDSAGAALVGTSDNAQQAIAEISVLKPDLILLDIALRTGTGFDVLNALSDSRFPATKVVLTNYATAEYRAHSLKLGATHFFDKSSEADLALRLISNAVAERQGAGNTTLGQATK
jgi:DNA-binding NtrC family response regulator